MSNKKKAYFRLLGKVEINGIEKSVLKKEELWAIYLLLEFHTPITDSALEGFKTGKLAIDFFGNYSNLKQHTYRANKYIHKEISTEISFKLLYKRKCIESKGNILDWFNCDVFELIEALEQENINKVKELWDSFIDIPVDSEEFNIWIKNVRDKLGQDVSDVLTTTTDDPKELLEAYELTRKCSIDGDKNEVLYNFFLEQGRESNAKEFKELMEELELNEQKENPLPKDLNLTKFLSIPEILWQKGQPLSRLLRPDCTNSIEFLYRENELDDLKSWCNFESKFKIHLISADGGMGKTRLAIELCKTMKKSWLTGFLSPHSIKHYGFQTIVSSLKKTPEPILLVLDYAEKREDEIIGLTEEFTSNPQKKVRVLLLARSASHWWDDLKLNQVFENLSQSSEMISHQRLEPLTKSTEFKSREAYVKIACETFTKVLDKTNQAEDQKTLDYKKDHYSRALVLLTAALVIVADVNFENFKDAESVFESMLLHEQRHWRSLLQQKSLDKKLELGLRQALVVINYGGGVETSQDAIKIFRKIPVLKDQSNLVLATLSTLLQELYPGTEAYGKNYWIEPLLPDEFRKFFEESEVQRNLPDLDLLSLTTDMLISDLEGV